MMVRRWTHRSQQDPKVESGGKNQICTKKIQTEDIESSCALGEVEAVALTQDMNAGGGKKSAQRPRERGVGGLSILLQESGFSSDIA